MKKTVEVTMIVEVEVDESKFTPEFMREFRESFYDFHEVEDHIMHIAQLEARGLLSPRFTEGYGPLADMGIKADVVDQSQEIPEPV
ncbi:hypothetical protein [Microvirga lotononidis]|uniref:Uncharacterized protein n=1 Tax=Microvirga lotononidis TaxID=864069 RepID=I4YP04_9HYPH|nr:hypothetical protein [Microvirga lotononidis]EIM25696.1 hypothetical protein MicloDRAFT_00064230 [Microvirga lotononidis]WQO25632.1 hypothetical protein U0023_12990 [Microvirga lotononidis]